MTGPERADTKQMQAVSDAIEAACQSLQEGTGQIVGLLGRLAGTVNESGTSQALRRLGEQLQESDTAIHQRMLDVGRYLGESASVIEAVLNESQADRDETTRKISGGKYGSALNG